jgi:hypothetical protein
MGGACGMEDKKNACRILVGVSEGKRPIRRTRCRWKDNIKMGIGWDDQDWILPARETCTNLRLSNKKRPGNFVTT